MPYDRTNLHHRSEHMEHAYVNSTVGIGNESFVCGFNNVIAILLPTSQSPLKNADGLPLIGNLYRKVDSIGIFDKIASPGPETIPDLNILLYGYLSAFVTYIKPILFTPYFL